MGHACRADAEKVEKALTNGLNGEPQAPADQHIVDEVRNYIRTDISADDKITATHEGGSDYKNFGDVHISVEDYLLKTELKTSEGIGRGTYKNLGQATLKELDPNIPGYQEFDQSLGLMDDRRQIVEEYLAVELKPTASDYIGRIRNYRNETYPHPTKIYNKTEWEQDELHSLLCDNAKPGQQAYCVIAAKMIMDVMKDDPQKVQMFVDGLLEIPDGIFVVVRHYGTPKQTVRIEDYTKMDKVVTHVIASGQSVQFLNKDGFCILKFQVTWGNVCQGVQNPRFNVFVGNAMDLVQGRSPRPKEYAEEEDASFDGKTEEEILEAVRELNEKKEAEKATKQLAKKASKKRKQTRRKASGETLAKQARQIMRENPNMKDVDVVDLIWTKCWNRKKDMRYLAVTYYKENINRLAIIEDLFEDK